MTLMTLAANAIREQLYKCKNDADYLEEKAAQYQQITKYIYKNDKNS